MYPLHVAVVLHPISSNSFVGLLCQKLKYDSRGFEYKESVSPLYIHLVLAFVIGQCFFLLIPKLTLLIFQYHC